MWNAWAIPPIAVDGVCDEMRNMSDDGYGECYAAAPWSIVLGNPTLFKLFLHKNAQSFTPQLLCWKAEGFCTQRDHLINTRERYHNLTDAWFRKWDLDYRMHVKIPLRMLDAILAMHDADQTPISHRHADGAEEAASSEDPEVVTSSHGISSGSDVLEAARAQRIRAMRLMVR